MASSDPEKLTTDVNFFASKDVNVTTTTAPNPALEKVWRKIDRRIVPMMAVLQFLSLLDQTNLGNARIAGLQQDLKMSNHDFSMLLVMTTVPYIIVLLPMNLALKVVGPDIMLPTMLTLWAIVTTLQGTVKSYSELLVCRFFLGLFEGGLFSAIIIYLSLWYPRQQLQQRISAFVALSSITGAFSGLLAYGIIRMDGIGNRPGWAWILILEGLFSVVCGVLGFLVLPRGPAHARFLNESEKEYVLSQLRVSGSIDREDGVDAFSWREVGRAFGLPHVWMLTVISFLMGTLVFTISYFTPSIVAGLGYTNVQAQIYSVPPVAVAAVFTMASAYISDRFGARGLIIISSTIFTAIGFSMFLAVESLHVKYGSLFLIIPGAYAASPALSTWIVNNTAPHTRRATAVALTSIMYQLGGVLATWLLGTLSPGPRYEAATITLLAFSGLIVVVSGVNLWYLVVMNRRKAVIRLAGVEVAGMATAMATESGDGSAWFVYRL